MFTAPVSAYTIFTLVAARPDAVPADPVPAWPDPLDDPDSSGNRPGEVRHYGVDGRTVGVWVHGYPVDRPFVDAIFDSYEVDSVAFTISDDTSDTCTGELHTPGADGARDEYSELEHNRQADTDHEYRGRGLQAYAEAEWGIRPWTIWDVWDDRGWQPSDHR